MPIFNHTEEYYVCKRCGRFFTDKEGKSPLRKRPDTTQRILITCQECKEGKVKEKDR